jgi:hypothetical protein
MLIERVREFAVEKVAPRKIPQGSHSNPEIFSAEWREGIGAVRTQKSSYLLGKKLILNGQSNPLCCVN